MKKRLSQHAALPLVLALVLSLVSCALAESAVPIEKKTVGEGATTIGVYVQEGYTDAQVTYYDVNTNETTLLAALQKVALVGGEDASWGYNITTVDGIAADYDGKGQYWSIWVYDGDEEQFVPLETAVGKTVIKTGDSYLFFLEEA